MIAGVSRRQRLPFGTEDLDPNVAVVDTSPKRVRCYVRGCQNVLRTPTRKGKGDVCPDHGIRCHHSSAGGTYSYVDVRDNAIASSDLLATRVISHPFKFEGHRLGLERSEDMLSWNVFRSLQEAGCLHKVGQFIAGDTVSVEPFLFLWGICTTDDDLTPWNLLVEARKRFESNLPVERPLTEPDIALYLPGRYLILIEAKFTSPNTFYSRGPRKNSSSLTLDELLNIYHDPALEILDRPRACSAERVYYQLWRNMIFSEHMARLDHPNTKAYHVNLVRKICEKQSAEEFANLVKPEFKDRFQRLTWEQIYDLCIDQKRLATLRRYLETKTAGLAKAFCLG